MLSIALVGYCWAFIFALAMVLPQLSSSLENKDILVSGIVADIRSEHDRFIQFVFQMDKASIQYHQHQIPQRVILSWYQPDEELHISQFCSFTVRLKKHWRYANPGSFDTEKIMFLHGIGARGYIRSGECKNFKKHQLGKVSLRENWLKKFKTDSRKYNNSHLMSALSFGDREEMEYHDWKILRNTGTSHLLAISGLHLSAISAVIYFIMCYALRCSATICNRWPAQKMAALCAIFAAIFYAYLADFSLPTQRALIMVCIGLLAIILNKPVVSFNVLSAALIIVLINNPMSTLSAGFWMSFLAVFFIFVFIKCINTKNRLTKIIFLQFFLGATLFPVSLWFFSQASIIAPIVNLIAVPIVSLLILPLLLLSVLLSLMNSHFVHYLLSIVNVLFDWLWQSLEWAATTTLSFIDFYPSLLGVIACVIGLLILIQPSGLPGKYLSSFLISSLFFIQLPKIQPNQMRMTVLDVGQGLSVVLETANHAMIYDVGPRSFSGFSTGHSVVLPYLRYRGITSLDLAIVSHNDNDHSGGVFALIKQDMVETLMVSNQPELYPTEHIVLCRSGLAWKWDGIYFEILHPPENWQSNDNNRSCVLQISHSSGKILLVGDIEKTAENWLVDQYGDNLGSEILLVPHHGSTSSSSYRFVGRVHPQTAVFSAGYMNRYGFPHATIMQRYQEYGAQLVDITHEGAVTFLFDADKGITQLPGHRARSQRYWHATKE